MSADWDLGGLFPSVTSLVFIESIDDLSNDIDALAAAPGRVDATRLAQLQDLQARCAHAPAPRWESRRRRSRLTLGRAGSVPGRGCAAPLRAS